MWLGEPVQLTYYSSLDSVNVATDRSKEERVAGAASATSAVMAGLIVGQRTPVLSQTQAFDNATLVGLLQEAGDQGRAVLNVVRDDQIQVRLLADGHDEPTLLKSFKSALQNPEFHFSAWPEFQGPADDGQRMAAVAHLEGGPNTVPTELAQKLQGIADLDAALRASPAHELARSPGDLALLRRCLAAIGGLDLSPGGVAARFRLVNEIQARGIKVANSRTGWYKTISRQLVSADPETRAFLDQARVLVDLSYHEVVCQSLGAQRLDVMLDGSTAAAQALVDAQFGLTVQEQTIQLEIEGDGGLDWAQLPDVLEDLRAYSDPNRRLERFQQRHGEIQVRKSQDGSMSLSVRLGMLTVPTSLGAALAQDHVGGLSGMLVATVIGLTAATPPVGRLGQRIVARDAKRRQERRSRQQLRRSTGLTIGGQSLMRQIEGQK